MAQPRPLVAPRGEPHRGAKDDRDGELAAGDLQGEIRHPDYLSVGRDERGPAGTLNSPAAGGFGPKVMM